MVEFNSCLDDMPDKEANFLIARYNRLSEEIKFAKVRTWLVTYATLGLYGVIIHSKHFECHILATLISALIWLSSLFYLISSHISLCRNDVRMRLVLKRSKANKEIEEIIKRLKLCKNISRWIPWLHYAVVSVGFVVVLMIIYSKTFKRLLQEVLIKL